MVVVGASFAGVAAQIKPTVQTALPDGLLLTGTMKMGRAAVTNIAAGLGSPISGGAQSLLRTRLQLPRAVDVAGVIIVADFAVQSTDPLVPFG